MKEQRNKGIKKGNRKGTFDKELEGLEVWKMKGKERVNK